MSVAHPADSTVPDTEVVAFAGLRKAFSGVPVLRGVDLSLRAGEIQGLVGINGSGKSTLIKILAGYYQYDGLTSFRFREVEIGQPDLRTLATEHFAFVHQDRGLVPVLSIADNCALTMGYPHRRGQAINRTAQRRQVRQLLEWMGIDADPDAPVSSLGPAEATLLAMGRALNSTRAGVGSLLVLDEPTSALPEAEIEVVVRTARRVAVQGSAVLFVSHRLEEVLTACDVVTVLRDGRIAEQRLPAARLARDDLVKAMLGRALLDSARNPAPQTASASRVLDVAGLSGRIVRDLDLSVDRGEIVGVTGLAGCGKSELGRLVAGRDTPRAGRTTCSGKRVRPGSPRSALRAGVAYIPSERLGCGSLPSMTAFENLTLPDAGRFRRRGRLDPAAEIRETRAWMERTGTTPADPRLPFQNFSGGNQQKLVLAKWLRLRPAVLVVDEPTQGVDVGAKEDVYRLLRGTSAEGTAVLVLSSEPDELARICDRVLIMDRGRVVAELSGDAITGDGVTAEIFAGRKVADAEN